jgi:uncharacterized Ntn-hydrolase superfamily protein
MQTHHQEQITPSRPDHSTALKVEHQAAQEAADYDRWFDAKVQASMDGVKDVSKRVLSDEEVNERRAALRAKLQAMQLTHAI